jgi:hypothetical protein
MFVLPSHHPNWQNTASKLSSRPQRLLQFIIVVAATEAVMLAVALIHRANASPHHAPFSTAAGSCIHATDSSFQHG